MEKKREKQTYEQQVRENLSLFPKFTKETATISKKEKNNVRQSMKKCFSSLKTKGYFKHIKNYNVWETLKKERQ